MVEPGDIFPERKLGQSEPWGRSIEEAIRQLQRETFGVVQSVQGAGRASASGQQQAQFASWKAEAAQESADVAVEIAQSARDGNLISNPGFERGSEGWIPLGAPEADPVVVSGGRSGENALQVTGGTRVGTGPISVVPGRTYRVSYWIRHSDDFTPNPDSVFRVGFIHDPEEPGSWSPGGLPDNSAFNLDPAVDWKQFSEDWEVPDDFQYRSVFLLIASSENSISSGEAYLDDFFMSDITTDESAQSALQKADEALQEAAQATETADGKNAVRASMSEPDYDTKAPGDLWYVLDSEGRVVGVRVWNGEQYNPYEIVADSVLVPGSVGATRIADGAVTSPKIFAGSVTSEKMTIGDFSNLIEDPLFSTFGPPNGIWRALSGDLNRWEAVNHPQMGPSVSFVGGGAARLDNYPAQNSAGFPVTPGEELLVTADVISEATHAFTLKVRFATATSGYVSMPVAVTVAGGTNGTVSGSLPVPANAAFARFVIERSGSWSEDHAPVYLSRPMVRRKTTGELIVDGSITADKIQVGSIELDKLTAGSFDDTTTPVESNGGWPRTGYNSAVFNSEIVTHTDGQQALRVNITGRSPTVSNPGVFIRSPRVPLPLGRRWIISLDMQFLGRGPSDTRTWEVRSRTRLLVRDSSGTIIRTITPWADLAYSSSEPSGWNNLRASYDANGIPAGSTLEWEVLQTQFTSGATSGDVFDNPILYKGGSVMVGRESIYLGDGAISSDEVSTSDLSVSGPSRLEGRVSFEAGAYGDSIHLRGGDPNGLNLGSFDGVTLNLYMPPGQAGRPPGVVRVMVTGAQLYAMRQATQDSGWIDISNTLLSGMSGSLRVRKIGSLVEIRGSVTGSFNSSNTQVAAGIPSEYRPDAIVRGPAHLSGGNPGSSAVTADGRISMASGQFRDGTSAQFSAVYMV